MKYKELEKQIKELRSLYQELENEADKKKLQEEGTEKAKLLSFSFGCYQCDELLSREQLPEAFCNKDCKKAYWGNEYDQKKIHKSWTVEEMVAGLKRMAQ